MTRAENLSNEDPAGRANDYRTKARQSTKALQQTVAAIGILFGRPVRQALDLRTEPALEQYDEACDSYLQALDEAGADLAALLDQADRMAQAHDAELAQLHSVLADAVSHYVAHKARLPRRVPAWVDQAQTIIDAAAEREPF